MVIMEKEKYHIIEFKEYGDERGNLVVAEGSGFDVPFDIRRVFYMYGSDPDIKRGNHANKYTKFVLINVAGTSKVLVDDGFKQEVVVLDKPRMGLYLGPMVWKEMYDFSPDSVLLVLASEHYIESEYIRDYNTFLQKVRNSD